MKPTPPQERPGFPTVSPYIVLRDPAAFLAFCRTVFAAGDISCHRDAAGRIAHAEIRIGDSTLMVTTESPQFAFMRSVEAIGETPVHLFLYLPEVDAAFARALAAGATPLMPVTEQPYGRSGGFKDPSGLCWWLSTHREASPERG